MVEPKQRVYYLDVLRVLATLGVVLIHTTAKPMYVVAVGSGAFWLNHLLNGMVRWAVPVFVMISGALLLEREISFPVILRKYVLRLAVPFLFWGVIYALDVEGKANTLAVIIRGDFHLWYLLMAMGLYLCQPFLHEMVGKKHLIPWFLGIGFLFSFLIPQMVNVIQGFCGEPWSIVAAGVSSGSKKMAMQTVQGYAFYFVVGYWLSRRRCSDGLGWTLAISGTVLTWILVAAHSFRQGGFDGLFYDYFTGNVAAQSVGVFILIKNHEIRRKSAQKAVLWLSKYSFGVYLSHVLVMEILEKMGIAAQDVPVLVWTVGVSLVVLAVAYGISWVLNQIPLLRRTVM